MQTSTPAAPPGKQVATLAGGCFWCLEAAFQELAGVESAVSGYIGGHLSNPTYEQVCSGTTGHAEAIRITFDPALISFRELLDVFFTLHDPTTLNRQGNDIGTQYRSAIFCHDDEQRTIAHQAIAEWNAARHWPDPIVTEVDGLPTFYPAEDYHQEYYDQNPNQPYCMVVVSAKVAKVRASFGSKVKR